MNNPQQLLTEVRHPEPIENLVESIPVKDGMKLSQTRPIFEKSTEEPWADLRGSGWLVFEDWS